MHEMAIVEAMVEAILDEAGGRPVARVAVEIGALSGVVADAVAGCFEMLAELEPQLAGATLAITIAPGRGACARCGVERAVRDPLDACACGHALRWTAGTQVVLREVA